MHRLRAASIFALEREHMRLSFKPFAGAVALQIPISQFEYAVFVGKLWGEVPRCLPEEAVMEIFVDSPSDDLEEGMEILALNMPEIRRKIHAWMISPLMMN